MSIKYKLILIIGAILLVFSVADYYYITTTNRRLLDTKASEDGQQKIISTRQLINLYFNRVQEDVRHLADNPDFLSFLAGGGRADKLKVIDELTSGRNAINTLENIGLLKIEGSKCIMVATDKYATVLEGRDLSERDYCQGILKTGAPYISGAFNSAITGNRVVGATAPVKTLDGQVVGFVVGVVNITALRGYLWDLQSEGDFMALFDRNGQKFLDTRNNDSQNIDIDGAINEISRFKSRFGHFTHKEYTVNYDKMEFATIAMFKNTDKVFALGDAVISTFFVSNILFIIIIFIAIYFIVSIILSGIVHVAAAADNVTRGELDTRVEEKYARGSDEIGVLVRAFNQMLSAIHDFNADLEKKVKERTESLSQSREQLKTALAESERLNKLMVGRELKMIEMKKAMGRKSGGTKV